MNTAMYVRPQAKNNHRASLDLRGRHPRSGGESLGGQPLKPSAPLVLSENFLASPFTQPQCSAAFVQDPMGEPGSLLLIRVRPCNPARLTSRHRRHRSRRPAPRSPRRRLPIGFLRFFGRVAQRQGEHPVAARVLAWRGGLGDSRAGLAPSWASRHRRQPTPVSSAGRTRYGRKRRLCGLRAGRTTHS